MTMIAVDPCHDLAGLELLSGLTADALEAAGAEARFRRISRNTRIFNQGDMEVRAHALLDGAVRILQSGSDGEEVVVRFITAGEMFGAVALFTDHRYPADAETLRDSLEVSWSETALAGLMERHPQIAINMIRIVGRRLQEAQERIRELATQRVEQRIAHALLRLSRRAGRTTSAGVEIDLPLRRKDIADICGTTLHSASRILTPWEKAGWLVTRDQRLTIREIAKIRWVAEHFGQ
ncbi:MAG TPA: Crp/Fnr family transcriptional regulator [Xanthobacteraceae bacterium]|jgi:CRP-like cAMP-binding protein|nr:Crp/Fnr family transcriptional regulator [Xanthobacteraceae bacterium]